MVETEEWFRGFNCWPLPLLTLSMCLIETYYYVMFTIAPDYVDALLDTGLAWTPKTRNETHRFIIYLVLNRYINYFRWFTYSFLHGGSSHFFTNIMLQVMVGLLIEMEHKVAHQVLCNIIYCSFIVGTIIVHLCNWCH